MKKEEIALSEITAKYRILGVAFNATQADIRRARNRLLSTFHPDRHPHGWKKDNISPQERVHLIQDAYLYITHHYEDIQEMLRFLGDASLSNTLPSKEKSYWVYTIISTYDKKDKV